MQIKSILAGAAIALVAGLGAASADDMKTLDGIQANPLSTAELDMLRGKQNINRTFTGALLVPDLNITNTGADVDLNIDSINATPGGPGGPAVPNMVTVTGP